MTGTLQHSLHATVPRSAVWRVACKLNPCTQALRYVWEMNVFYPTFFIFITFLRFLTFLIFFWTFFTSMSWAMTTTAVPVANKCFSLWPETVSTTLRSPVMATNHWNQLGYCASRLGQLSDKSRVKWATRANNDCFWVDLAHVCNVCLL